MRPLAHIVLAVPALALALAVGCGAAETQPEQITWPAAAGAPAYSVPAGAQLERLLASPLDKPITLRLRDVPLEKAIREITSTVGIGYALIEPPKTPPVQLDAVDLPARKALDWVARQAGAFYEMSDHRTVAVFWNESWALRGHVEMRRYSVGGLLRFSEPVSGDYAARETRAWEDFLENVVRRCLQPVVDANPQSQFIVDSTKSQLTATLTPLGHEWLGQIVDSVKKTRTYEPPPQTARTTDPAAVLATPIDGNIEGDARDVTAELARRGKANVGFDYTLVAPERRRVTLKLGRTTLGDALDALAKSAGLGEVVPERGGGIWILGPRQTARLFWQTGELSIERCVFRTWYIAPAVRLFGSDLIVRDIHEKVAPGEWGKNGLPVAIYNSATGRLFVVADPLAQDAVALVIQRRMQMMKPERTR